MKSSSEPTSKSVPGSAPRSITSPEFHESALKEVRDYFAAVAKWEAQRTAAQSPAREPSAAGISNPSNLSALEIQKAGAKAYANEYDRAEQASIAFWRRDRLEREAARKAQQQSQPPRNG